ncbi:hypothetical protein K432DRAFT_297766 [Lepidopterella palustris CBS 459.81]|uniref:Heterokaryon incompatibility domain-containing protein n=1 Tax=Lepidopterella palustris CBS 459.81 TaxID=1314670 RepID=A0A8E2EAS0_9PEZI|nr:hypothetical protein K432DRAFT_297766 [Lepidopterella palustris CBS 459.81]
MYRINLGAIDGGYQEAFTTFTRFLSNPYFSRVWVLQEIAVSTQAFLCCGATEIEWPAFNRFAFICRQNFQQLRHSARYVQVVHAPSYAVFNLRLGPRNQRCFFTVSNCTSHILPPDFRHHIFVLL